jgi:2-polyprenyl-3-methyl-5-hydroxy-6-metoxy-1,4-benzoquinol methylase
MPMSNFFRRLWIRTHLRKVGFSDNFGQLDSLYMVKDPWQMESRREQYRFEETNRLIQELLGSIDTLLEVGCGEGHQSLYLNKLCKQLYGIDVSKRAISRAKKNVPTDKFAVNKDAGIILPNNWPDTYDLVTLCEVAYYAKDPELLIDHAIKISKNCIITYYEARSERLDPIVKNLPVIHSKKIAFEQTEWKVFLCKGNVT